MFHVFSIHKSPEDSSPALALFIIETASQKQAEKLLKKNLSKFERALPKGLLKRAIYFRLFTVSDCEAEASREVKALLDFDSITKITLRKVHKARKPRLPKPEARKIEEARELAMQAELEEEEPFLNIEDLLEDRSEEAPASRFESFLNNIPRKPIPSLKIEEGAFAND